MILNKKIILIGHFGVGKTSMINKFVHKKFSEEYITSIGVRVDKKLVTIDNHDINLLIWDISGEQEQKKVPESYHKGAHCIIYVVDPTRKTTYLNIDNDLLYVNDIQPETPIVIVVNKFDLIPTEADVETIKERISMGVDFWCSAKLGSYVEELFIKVGEIVLKKHLENE